MLKRIANSRTECYFNYWHTLSAPYPLHAAFFTIPHFRFLFLFLLLTFLFPYLRSYSLAFISFVPASSTLHLYFSMFFVDGINKAGAAGLGVEGEGVSCREGDEI
jgi:hypothetical protein